MYLSVFLLLLVRYALALWVLEIRLFDQDEFSHLHSAWCIFKGLLPYHDFFEHHTPWFYFSLAPFFSFFDVETKAGDAIAFLLFARRFMWLITGVILSLTFWLGKLWRDSRVALVGTLFLVNTEIFWAKALEIRPEPLAVTFWLLSLLMLVHAVRGDNAERSQTQWQFVWSGVFLGAGFMALQKVVYALPGLAVSLSWYLVDARAHGTHRIRLQNVGYQVIGFCVPVILTFAYFYLINGFDEFLRYNFLFNLGLKYRFTPYSRLHQLIIQNPYLALLGGAGLIRLLLSIFRQDSFKRGDFILILSTLGLIGGLFLIPIPYEQNYLMLLPLLALLAGAFLVEYMDKLADLRDQIPMWQMSLLTILISLALMIGLALVRLGADSHWPSLLVNAYWFSAFMGAVVLIFLRTRTLALTLLLVALSAPPYIRMHANFRWRNTAQLEAVQYVIDNTVPTDTVMDGFTGSGVFRPHAYFYGFLPYNIRQMITDEDRNELLKNLRSGRVAPELILFDDNLRDLSPGITAFFVDHYEPTGKSVIWRRKEKTPVD